jgi:hypothetical protein
MARRLQSTAARTLYVITDRRAIIFNGGYYGDRRLTALVISMATFFKAATIVKSYAPTEITDLERVERDDGSGDVLFGAPQIVGRQNGQPIEFRTGFFTIADASTAEHKLRELTAANAA